MKNSGIASQHPGLVASRSAGPVLSRVLPGARPLAAPPSDSGLRPVLGGSAIPVLGDTLDLYYRPVEFFRRQYERFGPVSWAELMGRRVALVTGPDAMERVLVNRDKAFSNTKGWQWYLDKFFPRGLMLLDFDEHLHHRRIMQQAFTPQKLRGYLSAMNPIIADRLSAWPAVTDFHAQQQLKQLTLNLATEVFMGEQLGAEADKINTAFVDCVRGPTAFLRFPVPGLRWSRGLAGRRLLETYLRARIGAKRRTETPDLFSVLCHARSDDGDVFSDDDIVNHMAFLLMAAHDTSTITLTTMTYHLGRNAEWQDRLRAQSLALGKEFLDYDDLESLPGLDWVMKESLRLLAPLTAISRKPVRDTEILGHHVPAGTWVLLSPLYTHLMPEYWPNPETFDPERFSPARREDKVHRFAWVPFGGGAHKCIGMYFGAMEVKAIMHQMLLRYRWSVAPEYRMKIDFTTLPSVKDGLPLRLGQGPLRREW